MKVVTGGDHESAARSCGEQSAEKNEIEIEVGAERRVQVDDSV